MNRLSRLRKSVVSGYVVLGANIVYSLASVPIALHYLDAERFGLWALAMQLAGYLQLIDFGMSGAISRILIDYKDDPAGGRYGSTVKTGGLVLLLQSVAVALGGVALAFAISGHLNLPAELVPAFQHLFCWLSLSAALGFATKISAQLLAAHQRHDLINYSHLALFAGSFAVLWLGFHAGLGVHSLALASLAGVVLSAAITFWSCLQLRLFPRRGAWGQVDLARFRELFAYGKDLFLIAVGTQLVMASQTILVTKVLGLHAAATWSVCTRVYGMLSQFIWRPFDMSCPGLSEMFVRGETGQLRHRYRGLVVLTLSLSAVSAVLFAALHQSFVSVWTEGRIQWPVRNDILLGAQTILLGLVHCHCSFPGITKQIGAMRYIYFVEGIAFLVLGYFTTRAWGLTGVIVAAIVCALLGSFAYGLRRTRAHFALTWTEVLWQWSAPAVRLLAIATPVAIAAWYASRPLEPWLRLLGGLAVLVPFCALVFLRFGLERELRRELLSHVPVRLRGPTRLLLGSV